MFGSTVIEIAIGLVFIYLVLSFVCTSVNEYISQLVRLREETLFETIHGLFSGLDRHRFAEDIFEHDQVRSISKKSNIMNFTSPAPNSGGLTNIPSSVPPSLFSSAVLDLLGIKEPEGQTKVADLVSPLSDLKYDETTIGVLRPLINAANGNLDQARKNIEAWYAMAIDRATHWYKRKAQVLSFLVAVGVVTVSNADSLMLIDRLWSSPAERTQIEAFAKNAATSDQVTAATQKATMGLLGWTRSADDVRHVPNDSDGWVKKILGLLVSAFAVSLGAPFWFDKLKALANIQKSLSTPPPDSPPSGPRVPSSDAPDNPGDKK